MRPTLPSLAVALLPCCGLQPAPDAHVASAPEAATGRDVASPPDASTAGDASVVTDAAPRLAAPTDTARDDPCDLRAPVDLRLRRTLYDRWWDAVRASPRGEQVTIGCGNHGYNGEQRVRWGPAARGLGWRMIEREMPADCGWRRDGADVDTPDAGEGGEVDGGAPHPTGQPTL